MAQIIADATRVTVELWDERMTTMAASRSLTASGVTGKKAKARIDEASAVGILESWLAARRHGQGIHHVEHALLQLQSRRIDPRRQ